MLTNSVHFLFGVSLNFSCFAENKHFCAKNSSMVMLKSGPNVLHNKVGTLFDTKNGSRCFFNLFWKSSSFCRENEFCFFFNKQKMDQFLTQGQCPLRVWMFECFSTFGGGVSRKRHPPCLSSGTPPQKLKNIPTFQPEGGNAPRAVWKLATLSRPSFQAPGGVTAALRFGSSVGLNQSNFQTGGW